MINTKLDSLLTDIQKPGRYIGCEIGIPNKNWNHLPVKFAISYPDIYEIGMSNHGIKLIYDKINHLDFASCERVFSPWLDMEELLRKNQIPLFTLESKTPLNQMDILGISIQYELLFTNFLNILELGHIPVFRKERTNSDPIVILGGPGVANPAPFSHFADLIFIGEAEESIIKLVTLYKELKESGADRQERIRQLAAIPGIYNPNEPKKNVNRQVYRNFSTDTGLENPIIPVIDVIQNKLVVEIMRGCPNKCRFCQAGVIYKPHREKDIQTIINTIEYGLKKTGVTEVTLSSLSSGDYSGILELSSVFNRLYKDRKVSFSFPSIKVESFDTNLLDQLSTVRKSGLTFAVECGSLEGQYSINKPVFLDKVEEIIRYAVSHGWQLLKFYFMIGLPHIQNESELIIEYIRKILSFNKKIKLNINLAVFVPKPHTPYQFARQLDLQESIDIINHIRFTFKNTRAKIKAHDPYMSYIEGFVSRGDEKIGMALYEVYKSGARFDGWDDQFKFAPYQKAFEELGIAYSTYLGEKETTSTLPWDSVFTGVSREYLIQENEKSQKGILTESCKELCEKDCQICTNGIHKVESKDFGFHQEEIIPEESSYERKSTRYIVEFKKTGLMKFIGHIDTLKYFERIFSISGLKMVYTQGFNPHLKLQFSSPLPLGVESVCEVLEFFTEYDYPPEWIMEKLSLYTVADLSITRIKKTELKKISLINQINLITYYAKFEKIYYNEIKSAILLMKENQLSFVKVKNKADVLFYYSDFIQWGELTDEELKFSVKITENSPKVSHFIRTVFKEIPLQVIKSGMYSLQNDQQISLFDL